MTTLRLYLKPGGGDSITVFPWAVLDQRGLLIEKGESTADGWPRAEQVELIIASGYTLFTQVQLPISGRQITQNLIAYALEDTLGNEPSENLYCLGDKGEQEGCYAVAVTLAAPIQRVLTILKTHGRWVDRIMPEEVLLPVPPAHGWSVAYRDAAWLIRYGVTSMCRIPLMSTHAEQKLLQQLWQSVTPMHLTVCGQETAAALRAINLAKDSSVTLASQYDWRTAQTNSIFNFAQGELAANRRWHQWRPFLRRTALIIGVVFIAHMMSILLEAAWWSWRTASLSTTIIAQASALTKANYERPDEAIRAATRVLDQQRLLHGLPLHNDALVLMAGLAGVIGENQHIEFVTYEHGQLTVRLRGLLPELIERWKAQLVDQGIRLRTRALAQDEKELILSTES